MKKSIVISTLIATIFLNTNAVHADASKEENIGFASGAISGGLIAGPLGFIVGGAIGAVMGNGVSASNNLEQANLELANLNLREKDLQDKIDTLQKENEYYLSEQALNKDFKTSLMTDGLTLNLMFTSGSSNLSDSDFLNIQQLSKILTKFPELNIKLDGYTDPIGAKSENMTLSQNRVNAVTYAFNKYGITSDRLITNAHGEAEGYKIEDGPEVFAMARKVSLSFIGEPAGHIAQN